MPTPSSSMPLGRRTFRGLALVLLLAGAHFGPGRAGEIQSLLQRGLPVAVSPVAAGIGARSPAYPLKAVDRLPFYGLPYEFVDTTTGRLAFKVHDLSLPGRMPIVMDRFYDSGGNTDIPVPLQGVNERYGQHHGPFWMPSYSDYIQPTGNGFTLVPAEGGPITFVPVQGTTTYVKERSFPSNHLRIRDVGDQTLIEDRADGTMWQFYQPTRPCTTTSSPSRTGMATRSC